jgi:hypothetical protein
LPPTVTPLCSSNWAVGWSIIGILVTVYVHHSLDHAIHLQLVEPFHYLIKSKDTTHSFLENFYQRLDARFEKPITEDFFEFVLPFFPFDNSLFQNVIKFSYKEPIVDAVRLASRSMIQDAVQLATFMMPQLREVFALQRRDYGFSVHAAQFLVSSQAENIDDVPVHNIAMEQFCGKTCERLGTLKTVEAVSRSHILQQTQVNTTVKHVLITITQEFAKGWVKFIYRVIISFCHKKKIHKS